MQHDVMLLQKVFSNVSSWFVRAALTTEICEFSPKSKKHNQNTRKKPDLCSCSDVHLKIGKCTKKIALLCN